MKCQPWLYDTNSLFCGLTDWNYYFAETSIFKHHLLPEEYINMLTTRDDNKEIYPKNENIKSIIIVDGGDIELHGDGKHSKTSIIMNNPMNESHV